MQDLILERFWVVYPDIKTIPSLIPQHRVHTYREKLFRCCCRSRCTQHKPRSIRHHCIRIAVQSARLRALYFHAQMQASRSSRSSKPLAPEPIQSLAHRLHIGARTQ